MVQFGRGGQAVIATMNANGSNLRVIASGTSLQSDGVPDYAPNNGRIAFERVTFHRNGQGIAKADLFVRNNGRNTNITARRPANFFGTVVGAQRPEARRAPRSAHARIDEPERHGHPQC